MRWKAKSNGRECRPCQAEREGLGLQVWRWLRLNYIRGRRSGQRLEGNETWQEDKTEVRWFLEVRMPRSAGRVRWLLGATYWYEMREVLKKSVRSLEVSLSRRR
jgi:hypothetical protein